MEDGHDRKSNTPPPTNMDRKVWIMRVPDGEWIHCVTEAHMVAFAVIN